MPAVIASRGYHYFFAQLFATVQGHFSDFDVLLEHIDKFFQAARDGALIYAKGLGQDPSVLDNQEIVAIGWSPRRKQMRGVFFEQKDPAIGFLRTDFKNLDAFCAPWAEELQPLRRAAVMGKPSDLVGLARAQAVLFRKEKPGAAVGGPMITAVLNRDGMAISKGCEL